MGFLEVEVRGEVLPPESRVWVGCFHPARRNRELGPPRSDWDWDWDLEEVGLSRSSSSAAMEKKILKYLYLEKHGFAIMSIARMPGLYKKLVFF